MDYTAYGIMLYVAVVLQLACYTLINLWSVTYAHLEEYTKINYARFTTIIFPINHILHFCFANPSNTELNINKSVNQNHLCKASFDYRELYVENGFCIIIFTHMIMLCKFP